MSKLSDVLKSQGKEDVAEIENRVILLTCETPYDNPCQECNGIGTVMFYEVTGGPHQTPSKRGDKWLDLDGKAGWYHGTLKVEPCPSCQERERIDYLKSISGLTPAEFEIRLSDFKTGGVMADKAEAKQTVAKWAGLGNNLSGFATLHGSYGVGKSMLGKCLVGELIRNAAPARYIVASEMINQIREKFGEENSMIAVEMAVKLWKSYRILVLDEFDKLSMKTEWTTEVVHRLINHRYEWRKELFTMLITNTDPKDLPEDFGYLQSRMYAGNIIHVKGIDVRPGAK